MTTTPIVLEINTSGTTPKVTSNAASIEATDLKVHGEDFVNLYVRYCEEYCDLTFEDARDYINKLLFTSTLEAVPWWTAMTIRVIDRWKNASRSKVKVRLDQKHGIYLCYVYEEKKGGKVLLTSPVLAAARDRMLEVGTVHNYFRYYAATSFNADFLSQHAFEFDLMVARRGHITSVTLTPTPVHPEESEGIYNFKKWLLSLPSRENGTKEPQPVLVSSERVQSALPDVGAAWAHMKACNVLFLAPSGSGKDVVTEFFCDGLKPELTGNVILLSLAGLTSEECRLALFGANGNAKGGVGGALPRAQRLVNCLVYKTVKKPEPKSGIVFVDEIHHSASTHARASLLRVMESGEYEHPYYGNMRCKDLYFVFAASCTVDELRGIQPPDFWNRMDFIIEMQHPLDVELKNREKVIKDYFDLFFSREIESLVKRQVGDKQLGTRFSEFFVSEFKKCATPLSVATQEFAINASYLRPGLLSIRHVRALAQVLAANLIEFVFGRATSETETVEKAINKWISDPYWRNAVFGRLGEIIASR